MNRKERIAKMLSQMDGEMLDKLEEALNIESEEEKAPPAKVQKNRRRGRGHKRRNLAEETTNLEEVEAQTPRRNRRSNKRSQPRRTITQGKQMRPTPLNTTGRRKNKFDDFLGNTRLDASEQQEMKAAAKSDKQNKKRLRFDKRAPAMVEVKCRACHEEDVIAAGLAPADPKRYKCNECSGSACG